MKLWDLLWRSDLTEKFVLQKFLCNFLQCSREELRTTMDREISDEIIQKVLVAYKSYVEDKKPLEYILGHVDFFGREFIVNEATLIPRPETEYMITAVTEYINEKWKMNNEKWMNLLLDIGTGCGVLWISVLLQNPDFFSRAIFSDYYANALEVAKINYQTLITSQWLMTNEQWPIKVDFLQSDLLDFIKDWNIETLKDWSIVLVANLPYIPEEMFESNVSDNVKKWEPKPAFVWWDDGLDYYKIMLDQILKLVESRKYKVESKNQHSPFSFLPIVMFLEMMTWQVDVLRQLYDEDFIFEEVKTFHFNIRILKVTLK